MSVAQERRLALAIGVVILVALGSAGVADLLSDRNGSSGAGSPEQGIPELAPPRGWASGHVRDVNGNSIPRARVQVVGTRRATTADSQGRYRLALRRRGAVLSASHPTHAVQHVRIKRPLRRGLRIDFSLAATDPAAMAANTAHRLIIWTGCEQVADLDDEELGRFMALGVAGFVCSAGRLPSGGGRHAFRADGGAAAADARYELQRELLRSAAVRKAREGRLLLYLGFYASDATNTRTPFEEWFDDGAWDRELLPQVRDLAAAARSLGFTGLALDQELYSADPETSATWSWAYPGNTRPEQLVRAQAAKRGRQLMKAMLAGYPGLELVAYDTQVPGNWSEKVQEVVNRRPNTFATDVRIDLWKGLAEVPGYSAIRWFDATFYKTPHLAEQDWAVGLRYNAARTYELLSRRFSNWHYASSRLHVTPFSWIDEGPSDFEAAREPEHVERQLAAFRTWGAGGLFANYAYGNLTGFDYERYADAMRQATTPGTVDRSPPRLSIRSWSAEPVSGDRITVDGSASDNFAIRVVRWYDNRGRFGAGELVPEPDDDTTLERSTHWRIEGVPLHSGTNRITVVAEDIKGLARIRRFTVRR